MNRRSGMHSAPAFKTLAVGLVLCGPALVLPGATVGKPPALTFHVAPDGNDGNPGTREKPFATPAQARDAIRALKRRQGGKLTAPVTVLLRGGTYRLAAPLVFTAEDSG